MNCDIISFMWYILCPILLVLLKASPGLAEISYQEESRATNGVELTKIFWKLAQNFKRKENLEKTFPVKLAEADKTFIIWFYENFCVYGKNIYVCIILSINHSV